MTQNKKTAKSAAQKAPAKLTPQLTSTVEAPVAAEVAAQLPATAAAVAPNVPPKAAARSPRASKPVAKPVTAPVSETKAPAATESTPVSGKHAKPAKAIKEEKPVKAKKPKLVRDSYAMPEAEYARIAELKKRLAALGGEVKKSELLRAGIAQLAALDDEALKVALARVERIKTGRPRKR